METQDRTRGNQCLQKRPSSRDGQAATGWDEEYAGEFRVVPGEVRTWETIKGSAFSSSLTKNRGVCGSQMRPRSPALVVPGIQPRPALGFIFFCF